MMHCQTRRKLYLLYFLSFKPAVSTYQTNMSIYVELHSLFLHKTHRFFKIMNLNNPLTLSYHIYIPRTVTEDAREQF